MEAITNNIASLSNAGSTGNKRSPVKNLGKSEFLKLLVTQLKFQDPLNPMSDPDFIAQLAQFSSLEQLMSIRESISGLKRSFEDKYSESGFLMNFLGRVLRVKDPKTGVLDVGRVMEVRISGKKGYEPKPKLVINGKEFGYKDIVSILHERRIKNEKVKIQD